MRRARRKRCMRRRRMAEERGVSSRLECSIALWASVFHIRRCYSHRRCPKSNSLIMTTSGLIMPKQDALAPNAKQQIFISIFVFSFFSSRVLLIRWRCKYQDSRCRRRGRHTRTMSGSNMRIGVFRIQTCPPGEWQASPPLGLHVPASPRCALGCALRQAGIVRKIIELA